MEATQQGEGRQAGARQLLARVTKFCCQLRRNRREREVWPIGKGKFSPIPVHQLSCWHLSALLAERRKHSFPSAFSLLLESFSPPGKQAPASPRPFLAPPSSPFLSVKFSIIKYIQTAVQPSSVSISRTFSSSQTKTLRRLSNNSLFPLPPSP